MMVAMSIGMLSVAVEELQQGVTPTRGIYHHLPPKQRESLFLNFPKYACSYT
jgi:hypothetical protein